MANHVPRLGRRSLSPLIPSNEMDSVFLAELVTAEPLENPPETEIWLDSSDHFLTVTKTSDITADDQARNWPEVSLGTKSKMNIPCHCNLMK